MALMEWLAIGAFAFTGLGVVATVVGSHVSLKSDVRHMHSCLKLNLRATAKNGVRLNRIEGNLGIIKDDKTTRKN